MAHTHVVLGIRSPRTPREATAQVVLSRLIPRAVRAVFTIVRHGVIPSIGFPSLLVLSQGADAPWEAAPEETAS